MPTFDAECFPIKQGDRHFYVSKMSAGALTEISYAAVRRQSSEEGAVQRVLNPRRIESVKNFVLNGGDFPNAMVINWVDSRSPIAGNRVTFSIQPGLAQIIDGQHRIAGLQAAILERSAISEIEIPVAIYLQLSTRECADIFLSINTEQKPVPKSLVFDLYGVASEDMVDPAAVRARDIAMFLNEEPGSPYYELIKLPGTGQRRGGVALSTAVSVIKPLVEEKGVFEQIGVSELQAQKQIIYNVFAALRDLYGEDWHYTSNAFMYAAGFQGAMDFFRLRLLTYCNERRSFKANFIKEALRTLSDQPILQEEVKNKGGTEAARIIYQRLVEVFQPEVQQRPIEI